LDHLETMKLANQWVWFCHVADNLSTIEDIKRHCYKKMYFQHSI